MGGNRSLLEKNRLSNEGCYQLIFLRADSATFDSWDSGSLPFKIFSKNILCFTIFRSATILIAAILTLLDESLKACFIRPGSRFFFQLVEVNNATSVSYTHLTLPTKA